MGADNVKARSVGSTDVPAQSGNESVKGWQVFAGLAVLAVGIGGGIAETKAALDHVTGHKAYLAEGDLDPFDECVAAEGGDKNDAWETCIEEAGEWDRVSCIDFEGGNTFCVVHRDWFSLG